MGNGKIIINTQELMTLLNQYYEKQNATVEIENKKIYTGLYQTEGCATTIKIKKKLKIDSVVVSVIENLSEDDILTIIKEFLQETEYEPLCLIYLSKLEYRGYGMSESLAPVFNGIELKIAKKKSKEFAKRL